MFPKEHLLSSTPQHVLQGLDVECLTVPKMKSARSRWRRRRRRRRRRGRRRAGAAGGPAGSAAGSARARVTATGRAEAACGGATATRRCRPLHHGCVPFDYIWHSYMCDFTLAAIIQALSEEQQIIILNLLTEKRITEKKKKKNSKPHKSCICR